MFIRIGVYTDGGESDTWVTPPSTGTYSESYSKGFYLYYEQKSC